MSNPFQKQIAIESKTRSFMKSITWYFSDLIMTTFIAYVVTRNVTTALSIGAIQQTWEIGLYYFHERVWARYKSKK